MRQQAFLAAALQVAFCWVLPAQSTYSLTSISPTSAQVGGIPFTLSVTGTGFNANSNVLWNGAPIATTFVNSTQLTASVTADLIAAPAQVPISVLTTGTFTNSLTFTVTAQGFAITSTSPTSAAVGGQAFTLTVNGTGFPTTSAVVWNGTPLSTTFLSQGQLTALVPAFLLTSAGTVDLYVSSPSGPSTHFTQFIVGQGAPVISSLSPNTATVGSPVALTINGSGFLSGATINWNATLVPAVFVSATQLTANIPSSRTQFAGTVNITVQNPGGLASISSPFTVTPVGGGSSSAALAHFAVGSNFVTGVTVINTGATSAAYSISFYDDNGIPANVPFSSGTTSRLSGTLPAYGSLYVEAGSSTLPLTSGWAQISADSSIVIQESFRSTLNNTHYEAAVESSTGSKAFELPFDATNFDANTPLYTGVAIANLDTQFSTTVTCTARDSSGVTIPNGIVIPTLRALGHWAGFQFPNLTGRRGTLDCVSNTNVAVVGLRFIGTDTFSSLPVIKK